MTGHIAATALDGSPISDTDLARIAAEERLYTERKRQTVRVVASAARDVDDCRMLLSMLGLDGEIAAAAHRKGPARADLPAA